MFNRPISAGAFSMSKPSESAARPRRRAAKAVAPAVPEEGTEGQPASSPGIQPEERLGRIAQAAYFRAERRGFQPGFALEDWLSAEQEVDGALLQASARTQG
jgi:hypothetical protein